MDTTFFSGVRWLLEQILIGSGAARSAASFVHEPAGSDPEQQRYERRPDPEAPLGKTARGPEMTQAVETGPDREKTPKNNLVTLFGFLAP